MYSFVPQLLTYLDANFSNDWITELLGEGENISEENRSLISSRVEKLLSFTTDIFYKSLISGEYILETEKIIEDIEELKKESGFRLNPITGENSDTQAFLFEVIKDGYIDILKIYSNLYLNFIKLVKSQNENPNIDIVYEANIDTQRFFREVSNHEVKDSISFFDQIIYIYRIDHFFKDDVSTYSVINQLENSIKEYQSSEYFVAIKEKLNFLKFKWEVRQKSYKKHNFKISKAYIIDDELFLSTDNVKYNPTIEKLQKWKEYIECYYELDNWESNLNGITIDFKHKKYSKLSTLELLFLLKDYKDVNKDYENLRDVTKAFEKRYEDNYNLEQRFLYNKTYLYSLNNQFSSLLESKKIEEIKVERLKNKIEKIQNRCNIDNFFIDSKYINYRLNLLDVKFKNREELVDLSKEKEELDELTKDVRLYSEKLKWSKNNHNLLFQLPYKECLINSNIEDLDIFYASSIVLPLPHEESQKHYDKINDKLKELKQLALSVTSLNKEFSMIKELKNTQIKTLETIGVFTAIIAFILASIPSFSFVKEFYQAFLFTGIIGASLFLMVSLIFLFTRGFQKIQTWILILVSTFLFIFAIYSLKNSIYKVEEEIKKDYNIKIDSLKLQKSKIDSLILDYNKSNNASKKK
ncbi:hypothetical protein [Tenacibaculum maritimum]|uniref:hypothetical protein n=1 Tax=Tenacibaculum maritimum TaxID=107401 RepID=UPI003876A3A4